MRGAGGGRARVGGHCPQRVRLCAQIRAAPHAALSGEGARGTTFDYINKKTAWPIVLSALYGLVMICLPYVVLL